jgi:hypothetical protein
MTGLLLVAVVEMAAGQIKTGQEYEDRVLTYLARHGGVLERRLRNDSGATEVHVIRFADRAGYESFMADPERVVLRAGLGTAAPTTRVLEVHDL